jgi:benzylsuccinate CoA-transferase BbsF subunit
VVEFAWAAAGPTIGKHLAEHGAQVIRVESTTRQDSLRNLPPWKDNVHGPNRSGFYARYNVNKRGITLDLGTRRGLEIARRLVARADIVTESFSAGTMIRLGLGYRTLRAINPRIIMLSTNIHGQTGPWAEQEGAGRVGAAVAGFIHFVGWPEAPPMYVGTPYTDYVAPHFGLAALMVALDHRERTGEGQHVDVSQVECAVQFLAPALLDYAANGRVRQRRGNRSAVGAPHGAYRCQGDDRWCAIAVRTEAQWQAFCRALGEPSWAQAARFATMADRLDHAEELDALVERWTEGRSPEEVVEGLQEIGVPAGIVQRAEDLFADPQLAARDHFVYLEHPEIGRHAAERASYRFSRTPGRLERAAPCLGQDTEHVLREELGFTQEELQRAAEEGALR